MSNRGHILSGEEALASEQLITHVIPMPYSSRLVVGPDNELESELSWPSEIALHGAILVQEQHPDAKIVIVGETAYASLRNTTDLTVERAIEKKYRADRESLVPLHRLRDSGKPLNNTYRQVQGAAEHIATGDVLYRPLFVAFESHQLRVMRAARGVGLQANHVSVEDILRASDVHEYDDLLPVMSGLGRLERIKRLIGQDKGKLLNLLLDIGIGGPGYLDIVETENGPRLEEGFARNKQKRLQRSLKTANTTLEEPTA